MDHRLLSSKLCVLMLATTFVVGGADKAKAQGWEMNDDFGPVQVGFSLLRRFGWWDDNDGTDGQLRNDRPPATFHYNTDYILENQSLPASFPTDVITPIEGSLALYEVVYGRPFSDPGDVESANRVELSLSNSEAANTAGYNDISLFDNVDPNVRGKATLSFDYIVEYMPGDPNVMVDPFLEFEGDPIPTPNAHPTGGAIYDVPNTWDPQVNPNPTVEIRTGILYRDQDSAVGTGCGTGNGCWQYVGAGVAPGAENFDTVDDSEDLFTQIIDEGDSSWFQMIADGQVHTMEIPIVFLTDAERIAEEWFNGAQGQGFMSGDTDSQNTSIVDNFRFDIRGAAPRVVVLDNFKLEPFVAAEGQPGDFNGDGTVDAADYTVWRDNLGGDESLLGGNATGDGNVDSSDYDLWVTNFGASAGGVADAAAPEPTSIAILAIGLMGVTASRKRR